MFDIPNYKSIVSLIPGGSLQFLDFVLDTTKVSRLKRLFKEEKQLEAQKHKHCLVPLMEVDGGIVEQLTGKAADFDYEMDARKCLEMWQDEWLPLPYLRLRDQKWPDGGERFECGPSNWARCRFSSGGDNLLRIVLAFDMTLEEPPVSGAISGEEYYALAPKDVAAHATFRLASQIRDNAWFLNSNWVDEWLSCAWQAKLSQKRKLSDYVLEYLASYVTVLDVLVLATKDLTVQVINPKRDTPIDVDLILDIGNSRSTGILVETLPQKLTNLNDSYPLQLRDLHSPQYIYTDPFETRVEFSEVSFGNDSLSRRSGRRTPAFTWGSAVRIGPEAGRLATQAVCAEGSTGMSSPKRYLWDERPWQQTWRYNTQGGAEPMVTRGLLAKRVNSHGTPLVCFDDPLFKKNPILRQQEQEIAFESYFTRSSLMMFLMVEIILQALTTMNSPAQRSRRELPNIPRRLRRIIFTIPPGMPKAEQRIYYRWVKWAVKALWDALGWQDYYMDGHGTSRMQLDYRLSPTVRADWDEATCTQLVYLYNELTRKFQGDAHHLFKIMGKAQARYQDRPCLRIATIDVGGGTTDLSITSFELQSDESSSARIRPHTDFRDGFNIAGDDILRAIIVGHVLPALSDAAQACGLSDAKPLLAQLFGRDVMNSTQEYRTRRGQFIRQVAVPMALGLLQKYEQADLLLGDASMTLRLGDFFPATQPQPSKQILNYVAKLFGESRDDPWGEARSEAKAEDRGTLNPSTFDLLEIPIRINPHAIDDTIRKAMAMVLADLCEVIHAYNCDILLLSGRPSRLKGIISSVYAKLPVPIDRIIPMCNFKVGSWYPFADALGNITDPKTTVVVGAILCALAEGHLEGFSFDTPSLKLKSTARYIGEMDSQGQLKTPKIWFTVDLNNPNLQELEHSISFANPIAVGFRQLSVERWTTTRFYLLDFATEEARRKGPGRLPYKVNLKLVVGEQAETEERDEGELFIESIEDCSGATINRRDVEIRLQTLPLDEGYWLDTGIVQS